MSDELGIKNQPNMGVSAYVGNIFKIFAVLNFERLTNMGIKNEERTFLN